MTDERMDARLQRAGASWRALHVAPVEGRPAGEVDEPLPPTAPRRRHRRHLGLYASAAVVAAALVAGGALLLAGTPNGQRTPSDAAAVEGTVWRLVAVGNQPSQPNSPATMYIGKDGTLVADDSCTVIGVRLDVQDGNLHPSGDFDIRYRDCTDPGGEPTFANGFGLLNDAPSYEVAGDTLTLTAPGRPAMHFTTAADLVPPTLDVPTFVGSHWRLVRVSDAAGDHPISGAPTLAIEHGELTTSDGCNSLSGSVAVVGQQVTLKELSSTAIGCTGTVSTTAAVIDRIFSGHTVHEQIDGTTLTIKGDGAGALVYQWVPADAQATDPANLTGRTWHLTSVAGEPAAGTVDLRVDRGGAFASSDGCNELNGIAQVGQGSLSVNIGARTQVGCTQAETIESFLNQKPALWSIRDGKLLIYGGGAQAFALVYETDAPPPAVPSAAPNAGQLVGPTWALSSIETRSAGSDSKEASSDYGITLTFAKNGTFALHPKCTGSAGTATVHGSTVQFANVHGTGGNFCLSPQATQSRKVLDGTVKWKVDSDGLHLTKGGTTLTFEG